MDRQNVLRLCGVGATFIAGVSSLGGCSSDASVAPSDAVQLARPTDPPPRPDTKEACDACGGLWAVHGLVPEASCICRTSDAGKRCVDGRECVGQCLVDQKADFQVTDETTQPPRGFYTGTCSPYDTTFGCHLVIPAGIEEQLPLAPDEAARQLCID